MNYNDTYQLGLFSYVDVPEAKAYFSQIFSSNWGQSATIFVMPGGG